MHLSKLRNRLLVVTSEWPLEGTKWDISGIHVYDQVEDLRRRGITVDVLHFRGKKNPFRYLVSMLKLRRRLEWGYDLIHAHHGQAGLVALAQRSLPVVVTFHGSDLQGIKDKHGKDVFIGKLLTRISRNVARRADAVILVSSHLADSIPGVPFHLLPAGVDLDLFRPVEKVTARAELGFDVQRLLVLFVGNPNRPEKRYGLAKAVCDKVRAQLPGVELVTVHDCHHTVMPKYMNACDLLLCTSSSEGSPVAIREALACNLPVVSVDVGDIARQIGDVEGCEVSETDDIEDIARHTLAVLTRGRRLLDGRERAELSDGGHIAERLIEVYDAVLSSSHTRS